MRESQHSIDKIFLDRWSPRSFNDKYEITLQTLNQCLEAARWSPSCFNEQPWEFTYCLRSDKEFNDFVELLVEQNQSWAKRASALLFLWARKKFHKNDKENIHSWFDSGSAWLAFTLQARKLDLYTHAMAGIKREKIYDYFNVDDNEKEVICAVAIGKKDNPEQLHSEQIKMEQPNQRKTIDEFSFHGHFKEESK